MINSNLSEYNCKPKKVIIHNPVKFGSFKQFVLFKKEVIKENLLFRETPDSIRFSEEHDLFSEQLKKANVEVLNLTSLLTKEQFQKFSKHFEVNPNFVYTRDAIITIPWEQDGHILGVMGKQIRKCESEVMKQVARNLKLRPIVRLQEELILEGGDVIPIVLGDKRTLLIGYNRRVCVRATPSCTNEIAERSL